MNFKLSIVGAIVSIALTGCNGSSDSVLDGISTGGTDSKLTYTLTGKLSEGFSDGIMACVDLNSDLMCDDSDIVIESTNGTFTLKSDSSSLLTKPVVVYGNNVNSVKLSNGYDFKLVSPASKEFGEGKVITVSAVSSLVFSKMNDAINPLLFSDAVKSIKQSLNTHISSDIDNIFEIELSDEAEKQKLNHFNDNFVQYMKELDATGEFKSSLLKVGTEAEYVVKAFAVDDKDAMAIVKEKIKNSTIKAFGSNDTGVTQHFVNGEMQDQASDEFPGQDADYGLDSNGKSGFNLVKIDDKGNELTQSAENWDCVKDLNTGLMWEVKVDDVASPRYKDRDYELKTTTYTPNKNDHALATCSTDGNSDFCNTEQYVNHINTIKLCGNSDWRLPTANEQFDLLDLSESRKLPDADLLTGMNLNFFPYVNGGNDDLGWYWNTTRFTTDDPEALIYTSVDQAGDTIGDLTYGIDLCKNDKAVDEDGCYYENALLVRLVTE
ncbi:DUF1566 domain-containing protein [Photobacterium profundum]|uniref:Lcl C-terminal domain-containing protein n=1 Tax=Photobacterium profundum (strain SS9) TaxID=298386 RepID=Q6LIN2_PHOPR|nr:DUF1566 domain-containing protein [Photobacterium profundum]CAG22848.1 hypothetical protein PBPRB0976 [Photobacterium profundum SS9]